MMTTGNYVDTETMALRREKRSERQIELIKKYKTPLICFTMNIPGEIKFSPLIETVFSYGVESLFKEFSSNIIHFEQVHCNTGCEAFFSVNADASLIKEQAVLLENSLAAGRLYDIDVIGSDGIKLSRNEQRKCIICGNPAAVCARSRAHGLEALKKAANEILIKSVCGYISGAAADALMAEVHLTPKPGLVDENNSGANSDMDILLFEKSIRVLKPYFRKFAEYNILHFTGQINSAFTDTLRTLGIEAEKAMMEATGGVNTHKGAIYSLGLIVSAYAISASGKSLLSCQDKFSEECSPEKILFIASRLAISLEQSGKCSEAQIKINPNISEAVVQAEKGFPAAFNALKAYHKALEYDTEINAWIYALLKIMSELSDKNILRRGGTAGAEFVKTNGSALLKKGANLEIKDLYDFDSELIARNLNCGGCADILAAAMLLNTIDNTQKAGAFCAD